VKIKIKISEIKLKFKVLFSKEIKVRRIIIFNILTTHKFDTNWTFT